MSECSMKELACNGRSFREDDLVMKRYTGVRTNAFLAGAESSEIFGGFGDDIIVELHDDSTFQLTADAYVQKATWPLHFRQF